MYIYIVFGDEARSDGENIKAIYRDKRKAEEFVNKYGEEWWSIEEHETYD